MDKYSYLSNVDSAWLDDLYQQYVKDPASVETGWARFFEGFDFARSLQDGAEPSAPAAGGGHERFQKEFRVVELINAYRHRGHLFTRTNPVRERRQYTPNLALDNFGLSDADLDTVFTAGNEVGIGPARLRDIITLLEQTYCQSIGVEFKYIRNPDKVRWLQERMERTRNTPSFTLDQKKEILEKLNQAVVFEKFLGKKFIGAKRFSIEGAEALIPALDTVIEHGADEHGIQDFVLGMAHRGRLNVLANTLNKTYDAIFSEFEGKDYDDALVEGDVKYHMGYSSRVTTNTGKEVRLTLSPNPSHLESVDPVVEGITRAIIEQDHAFENSRACAILIHGDGAVAGQGVVYEVVQMAGLKAYGVGGSMHIVVNNQVAFTTNYIDSRTSTYCTDVAKTTLCPVFHVNGDDAEAMAYTIKLAMDYRQQFGSDVWVDLLCYRKHGHNEGDEPKFTQPVLYKAIAAHPDPREIYTEKLLNSGVPEARELAKDMERKFSEMLDARLNEAKQIEKGRITNFLADRWKGFARATESEMVTSPITAVDKATLLRIGEKLTVVPPGKKFFSKLEKILNDRRKMLQDDKLDWGMAELLAYGSLLVEGHPVRFSGQDVERGTFSHRHAVVKVEDSEEEFIHLKHIQEGQALFQIYNSLLSEYAVLGFEYGYALTRPETLTLWEAQFGDFVNGAQIILDQFLCCAEEKWNAMNGIVLLLPHGYEGQGAEHSSARMERFLSSCADGNMVVVNCTTPGNFFHALRRQLAWNFRKPLIVFTPKSLLRHPRCISPLEELATGGFREVIDDGAVEPMNVTTVVLSQGKIHYDLLEHREQHNITDTALVRVEQLHPLPVDQLRSVLARYAGATRFLWVQEEPRNMGAWPYMLMNATEALGLHLECISRPASGAPATGSSKRSAKQQAAIVEQAFAKSTETVKVKA